MKFSFLPSAHFGVRCRMQIYIQMKIENIFNLNDSETMKRISSLWERCSWGRWGGEEHPQGSATPALKNLPSFRTTFHQCQYGAVAYDEHQVERPIQKATSIHTTKAAMVRLLGRKCPGDHQHHWLEGRDGRHCAENYPEILAQQIAPALLLDEQVHVADDEAELTGALRRLASRHGAGATRLAYQLHRSLGHPRKEVLLEVLRSKNCSEKLIKAVEDLRCPFCQRFSKKKTAAPAHLDRAQQFNEKVQTDIVWLDLHGPPVELPAGSARKSQESSNFGYGRMVDETPGSWQQERCQMSRELHCRKPLSEVGSDASLL